METEELHLGYVDENSAIEIVNTEEITVRPDKINVGFAQSSNLYEWQVVQTESFYTAFMESDGYHLNITDAHGDAERQKEQLESLINAPMDILFVDPGGSGWNFGYCSAGGKCRYPDHSYGDRRGEGYRR